MRNYIILNNKKSDTISGLIIQELPPISKPAQRTQIETIDGRDGDIVTPLGYAAYDKTFTIGLYGTFDINEIIAYFATQGQVIFSNEPNKYYNYQIVDQIDYERLVRYKVATVTMHVQPFKYSSTETPIIVDSSDTVSGEGSNIALANTAEAPFNTLRHKGNATQKTLSGKNLFNYQAVNHLALGGTILEQNTYRGYTLPAQAGDTFTISRASTTGNNRFRICFTKIEPANLVPYYNDAGVEGQFLNYDSITSGTFTVPSDMNYVFVYLSNNNETISESLKIQIERGSHKTDYEEFCGGLPSPSPDYPQDIQVLTGDSTVKITGKNLIDQSLFGSGTNGGITISSTKDSITASGTATNYYPSWTMYADGSVSSSVWYPTENAIDTSKGQICDSSPHIFSIRISGQPVVSSASLILVGYMDGTIDRQYIAAGGSLATITTNKAVNFVSIGFAGGNKSYNINIQLQLEAGSTISQFEPYKGQSYVIPFGDTYLAAIGDYADEPVKVDGTWYIRRAIGKVVLDGSEAGWSLANVTTGFTRAGLTGLTSPEQAGMCDNFTPRTGAHGAYEYIWFRAASIGGGCFIQINTTRLSDDTLAAFKDWLSTHNTTVYYALATPTDEAITDQDLIDALDDFYDQAHAYKGHTHITATAADGNAPAVLAVDVNEDNESTVTNAGNTTSRPILTIYGQGDIGVYINDVEVLDVALGDEEYITLDSVEMEAYKDTTANLKNRLVTGDYSKLALNAGANKIRFTGKVTKYEISKYSRWL